ncbi:hypothetical protein B296_00010044 [Ensete ventricosum]|uniref:Jasmonate O-methyltransferase n=1 Tax=Ensete ventricosum TaxID=4639 RepID=A0A426YUY4_ENSVE|nr:hypothetical protein B296_00010044 [Ensete ventricosum]
MANIFIVANQQTGRAFHIATIVQLRQQLQDPAGESISLSLSSSDPMDSVRRRRASSNAYLKQFRRDLRLFLRCRAEEVVGGGRMVLALMGRGSPDHGKLEDCHLWELISEALNDMASEVINLLPCFFSSHSSLTITSSQSIATTTHAFALLTPFYIPSLEEMKQVVEEEGSFSITAMEQFEAGWDAVADQHSGGQDQQHDTIDHENGAVHERRKSYAGRMAMGVRAVLERMLKNHFGEGILDELFFRYSKLLEGFYSAYKPNVVVAMVRN